MSFTPDITEDPHTLEDDEDNGLTATRRFTVHATSQLDARAKLQAQLGITKGSRYTSAYNETPNPPLICRNISFPEPLRAAPIGGTGLFAVTVTYSERKPGRPQPVPGGPPQYYWDAALYSSRATVDRHGNRIKNYADQTMRVPAEVASAALEVQWYVTSFNPADIIRTVGSVNAGKWQGFEEAQAQCVRITPEEQAPRVILMRAFFNGRKIGWQPKPFNEGLQEKLFTIPVLNIPIYGANNKVGDSLPSPRPLGPDGRFLPANQEGEVLEVDLYEPLNWKALWGI